MTAIEMQARAELEASRRKMQAWRSTKTNCPDALAADHGVRPVLADLDFVHHRHERDRWPELDAVNRIHAAAQHRGRWSAPGGQRPADLLVHLLWHAAGHSGGYLPAEYGRKHWLAEVIRFINDILLSAPSIVVGLFVYTIVVAQMQHFSGWAGVIALALLQVPIVIRTTENMLRLVPDSMREAAYALGTPKWKMISAITLKASVSGIITGVLLAIARIAGETAPLLFTALSNQFWSTDMMQPLANLPVTIFKFAMSPFAEWQTAWAGVLIITLCVLLLNIVARVIFAKGKH